MRAEWKKAFTQIELIFVMLVVGILAVVAIPRLSTSRDDATAAKCTQETQQLLSEISQKYTIEGYTNFSTIPIEEMTNLRVGISTDEGISSPLGSLVAGGIKYMCDSENIVEIKGEVSGVDYNLTIKDLNPSTPAAKTASELVRKLNSIQSAGGKRVYILH